MIRAALTARSTSELDQLTADLPASTPASAAAAADRKLLGGTGVSMVSDEAAWPGGLLAEDAPVVHIRGLAYKGTMEARTRPA